MNISNTTRYGALLLALTLTVGCGSGDSGPPPGAMAPGDSGDFKPPEVDLGSPTDNSSPKDKTGSATDSGKGSGSPEAPKGDK